MANGNGVFQERIGHGWNQVRQLDAPLLCCSLIYVVSGPDSFVERAVDPFQRPHK
jgi:hypothetical protein